MVLNHHLLSDACVFYHVYLSRYHTYLGSSDLLSCSEELRAELFAPRTCGRIEPHKKVGEVLSGLVEDGIVELDEGAVGEVVRTRTSCSKKDGKEKKDFHG